MIWEWVQPLSVPGKRILIHKEHDPYSLEAKGRILAASKDLHGWPGDGRDPPTFRISRISSISPITRFVVGLQVDIRLAQLVRHTWRDPMAGFAGPSCRDSSIQKNTEREPMVQKWPGKQRKDRRENHRKSNRKSTMPLESVGHAVLEPFESLKNNIFDPGSNSNASHQDSWTQTPFTKSSSS